VNQHQSCTQIYFTDTSRPTTHLPQSTNLKMSLTKTMKAIPLLVSLATAATLPRRQTTTTSETFRLVANVTGLDTVPTMQGRELTYNLTSPCHANLILAPAGQTGAGFYTTSSTTGVAHLPDSNSPAGLVVQPGGTATVPSLNIVQAVCADDAGTQGVVVAPAAGLGWGLWYETGSWMACPASAWDVQAQLGGDAVVLSYKQAGQRTILGCADVDLYPVCDSEEAADVDGIHDVTCASS
jgi:hypothetical protein